MCNRLNLLWASGMAALLATHLAWLGIAPGLHFDEAWAANYAARIAFEPGFWPIVAQSPYTSAWSHYLGAGAFRLFGPTLDVFRGAGLACVAAGISALSAALLAGGFRRAAASLPWIVAGSLALVLNHRFAIELTTFHVLCFGLLAWGTLRASQGSRAGGAVACAAFLLGVTSHLLFLAPGLGLLLAGALPRNRCPPALRRWSLLASCILLPFFISVFFQVPERDKAAALVAFDAGVILWLTAGRGINPLAERWGSWLDRAVRWASVPFLLMLVFFAEGHWSVLQMLGGLATSALFGLGLFCAVLILVITRREWARMVPSEWITWFCATTLATGCLMLSPAARYFEIPLLFGAVAVALGFQMLPRKVSPALLGFLCIFGVSQLLLNYGLPAREYRQREASTRFLFFKDSSRDFLPKQQLAQALGARGCRFDQVSSDDSRIMEALRFLSRASWKVNPEGRCPAGGVSVYRRSAAPRIAASENEAVGEFVIFQNPAGGT